jgi:hypothetical protein
MQFTLLKDKDWAVVEDKLCLVAAFEPTARVQEGKVVAVPGLPLASVRVKPESSSDEMTGFISHEVDFLMLWAAFHHGGVVSGARIERAPSRTQFDVPPGMEDTVQKFRVFYTGLLTEGGETRLRQWISHERVLAERLEPGEKAVFLSVVGQLEGELLGGEEVWLTWTRNRYKAGAGLFMRLLPKLIVMVAKKGAFDLLRDPSLRPDLNGQSYAREVVPLITWTPEVME